MSVRDTAAAPVLWPALVAVAPLAAAFALALVVIIGWAAGVHPFWPTPEITASEAAAIRDAGELYRLLVFERHDPNRPWRVRAGMISAGEEHVRPIEVAARSGRPEIMRILLDHGASVGDDASRAALICRAAAVGEPAVVDLLLATGDRTDPRPTCAAPSPP